MMMTVIWSSVSLIRCLTAKTSMSRFASHTLTWKCTSGFQSWQYFVGSCCSHASSNPISIWRVGCDPMLHAQQLVMRLNWLSIMSQRGWQMKAVLISSVVLTCALLYFTSLVFLYFWLPVFLTPPLSALDWTSHQSLSSPSRSTLIIIILLIAMMLNRDSEDDHDFWALLETASFVSRNCGKTDISDKISLN